MRTTEIESAHSLLSLLPREQAVTCLKAKGIPLIIAASFSQTYLRNAYNNGFLCIEVPALVIHGEADPLIPVENGVDTAQTIPGAKLVRIPGMGHDLPKAVLPTVIEEIAKLAGTKR